MQFIDKLLTPGEHDLITDGPVGQLELALSVPELVNPHYVAILGHPHSLQGGTMNNKVVTTMARAFKELGIPSLRFNFRGVGQSAGVYDAGLGESEDMLSLVNAWQKEQPQANFIFAGFSFGSYVAYRAAAQHEHRLLITIAPPVHHYDYQAFQPSPKPWLIVQGEQDEVVSAEEVYHFTQQFNPELPVIRVETGHFFHGQLIALKNELMAYIKTQVHPL